MPSRPPTRFVVPRIGEGPGHTALDAGLTILSEDEHGTPVSSDQSPPGEKEERNPPPPLADGTSMDVDGPSFTSLELHDGETEPFAMVRCPHCACETAFPLRLLESSCEVCGGCIHAFERSSGTEGAAAPLVGNRARLT